MLAFYLTPAAIGYLSQFILALAIASFLVYRALRPRQDRPAHAIFLAAFFSAVTVLILLFFLETASPPDRRLYAVYLENTAAGLVVVLLLQFAYRFPDLPRRWRWEARLALGLSGLYALWELGFAVYRFSALLGSGAVYYRPPWPDYVMVVGFLWAPAVFFRQATRSAPGMKPTSWLSRLWKPQTRAARTARAFALVYLLLVVLSLTNLLLSYRFISANVRQLLLSVGVLAVLALFALVYLNSLPETTTFMIKLVGAALAVLLAVLGAAGWLIAPTYVASYRPDSLRGQTVRFIPNAGGGYDVTAVPFDFDPQLGDNLNLADAGRESDQVALDYFFSLYGREYRKVYVVNDGAVGFGASIDYRTIQYRYGITPAILALYMDFYPQTGESGVFARRDADRLTVTWNRLATYEQPETTYTFQLVLYPDGVFQISYADLPAELSFQSGADPQDGVWVVGAVPGNPAQLAEQSDFNALSVSGGPQGIVSDYYLAFRRYLHTLCTPLALLVLASSLVILVGFPLLFYVNLVRPLNTLLAGVRRVNAGDLNVVMPIQFQDEIGFLTQAFNGMIAALWSSITNLEDQVAQRTQQLERQNVDLAQAKSVAEERSRAAEAANQAKSVFLANMSHELRTPLNAILGFSHLLAQDANLTATQRENLAIIGRSGEHLLALLNDVLELSRIEAGRVELHPEVFDLHLLLQGLGEMFRLRAEQKGLELCFERAAEVPRYVCADQGKLRQVLINLLGNAVKFTLEGSVALRVSVLSAPRPSSANRPPDAAAAWAQPVNDDGTPARPDENRVTIRFKVADTGIGIAPDQLQAIFDPFVQVVYEPQKPEGTGLGLSISRQFVQLMGGELTAQSEGVSGRGSVFLLDLPVEVVDAASFPAAQPTRRAVALEPGQPAYRLLVVEDHVGSREWLVGLLAGLGFAVRAVANGQEALAVWQAWQPHLIWLDVRLPVMDGYETTQRIKSLAQGDAPVIVALSAGAFEEDRQRLLESGGDDFLRKPVRPEELVAALVRHLGVRFVYEKLPDEATGPAGEGPARGRLDLSRLPAAWVDALRCAVTAADAHRVAALAEEVRDRWPAVAQALTEAIDRFDYREVEDAIDRHVAL